MEELAFVDEELTGNGASCNQPDNFARCCAVWPLARRRVSMSLESHESFRKFCWKDLDAEELGGNASWAPANDSRYVAGYKVPL